MKLRKGALAGVAMVGTVTTTFALPGSQAGAARSGTCPPADAACEAAEAVRRAVAAPAVVQAAMEAARAIRVAEAAHQAALAASARQTTGAAAAMSPKGYPTGARYQSLNIPITCPGQPGVKADGAQFELFNNVAQLTARCDGRVRTRVKAKFTQPDNSVVIADTNERFDFADVDMGALVGSACYYAQRADGSWAVGQWAANWPEIRPDCNL